MTAFSCVFTIGRIFIHWRKRHQLGWDDFFNVLAATCLLAFSATFQVFGPPYYNATLYRLGISKIPPGEYGRYWKVNISNSYLF
ncbi:hypothetical protein BDV96DRAFT_574885 [Lophiotrema nucula]|uniref:Uncharacterized protein n=1 Tax=Lophiotrema nucula TaxID=690887 RepID=A0A6A5Z9V0_9PLEO|nr:hypothetical protein BDV96DRAFT_574885 [Lophiotrema nucula]